MANYSSALEACMNLAEFKNDNTVFSIIAYLTAGPLTLAIICQGLIGNLMAFAIFFFHSTPRPCIYLYLMTLSFWDGAVLVSAGLLYSMPTLIYGNEMLASVGSYVQTYPFWLYTSNCALIGTVWTVVILTVDRYLALCQPLWHRQFLSRKNIIRMLLGTSIAVCLYTFPRYFDLTIIPCFNLETNSTEKTFQQSRLARNPAYQTIYKVVGGFLFYSVVPCSLLFILTVRISIEMKSAASTRSWITSAASQPGQTTPRASNKMLLTVILKFLCCHSLPTAVDIIETSMSKVDFLNSPAISYTIKISNLLVIINSGTNFWVYLSTSQNFRHDCAQLLRGQCQKDDFINRRKTQSGRSFPDQSIRKKKQRTEESVQMNVYLLKDEQQENQTSM